MPPKQFCPYCRIVEMITLYQPYSAFGDEAILPIIRDTKGNLKIKIPNNLPTFLKCRECGFEMAGDVKNERVE
jgi:hypothetical protein